MEPLQDDFVMDPLDFLDLFRNVQWVGSCSMLFDPRFDGETYLAYKTWPLHVALLRGTTADVDGNVTMEKEALFLESFAIALAAHNSGGLVLVQVERLAEKNSLHPRCKVLPSISFWRSRPPKIHHEIHQIRQAGENPRHLGGLCGVIQI